MSADDMRRRGLASVQIDYWSWLRYGDREDRRRAGTVAWVLTGSAYRMPLVDRAAVRAALAQDRSVGVDPGT